MKKIILAFIVTLTFTSITPLLAQDIEKGLAAALAGDYTTALKEWKPLAEQGHARAQYNLGVMYYNGTGVAQDDTEAVMWYRRAAEQGYTDAQYNLGWMYSNGAGVAQDDTEAANWYRRAAEQGYTDAQYNLGWIYENGIGVAQDYVRSYMWYNIAATSGDDEAGKRRDKVAAKMTSEEVSKSQSMATECIDSNYKNCGF